MNISNIKLNIKNFLNEIKKFTKKLENHILNYDKKYIHKLYIIYYNEYIKL